MKRILFFLLLFTAPAAAQDESAKKNIRFEYKLKSGFNIGGMAPLSLPAEIRSIINYNPTLAFVIEGNVTGWFTDRWGVTTGVRFENKNMITKARVKNYNMEMVADDGGFIKGMWTGYVETKVKNSYVTIPVLMACKLNSYLNLRAGMFFSYLLDGDFLGTAYDGYIRHEDPTGEKVIISSAGYDFSDNLSSFSWGGQLGIEWKVLSHISIFADLTWGFSDIFNSDFDVVTFNMYPVYMDIGLSVVF